MTGSSGLALTDTQRELVQSSMMAPGTGLGLTGGTMVLTGALDTHRMLDAIARNLRGSDALTLRFQMIDGQILQRPADDVSPCDPEYLDLSSLPDPERHADAMLDRILLDGLDFFCAVPPVRNYLFKLSEGVHKYAIVAHHAQIDGWGFSVWVQNLAHMYNAGEQPKSGFLTHVAKKLDTAERRAHLRQRSVDYWLTKIPEAPAAMFPSNAAFEFRNTVLQSQVDPGRYAAWQHAAQSANVSMAAMSTAALVQEVARLTGQTRPILGLPLHNRPTPDAKNTVGMFANVLPLACDVDPADETAQVAAQILASQRSDFRHSGVSLADVRKAWGLEGEAADPLELTFSFELHDYDTSFDGVTHECRAFPPRLQSRPVQIYWREYHHDAPLIVDLCVRRDLAGLAVPKDFMEGVFDRLDALADISTPRIYLTDANADQPPVAATAGALPHAINDAPTLWEVFLRQADAQPDSIAAIDERGSKLTYGILRDEALRLATHLSKLGAGPERMIGLSISRDTSMLVGILGILATGAAYVPLDPAYPKDRIDYLLSDSGVRLVVADRQSASTLDLPGGIVHVTLPLASGVAPAMVNLPSPDVSGAAYVIYTSGSTGAPKGCVITHANVLALLRSTVAKHGYDTDDVWTLFHSYAFDFSVWEIWGAIACGGTIVVVSAESSRDPEAFLTLLKRQRVTVLSQTPTAFRSLLGQIEAQQADAHIPDLHLKRVIFGGEALEPAVLERWFGIFGTRTSMTNMYGITETTVHVTHRDMHPADTSLQSVMGDALPDWRLYVLNEQMEPCGPDEIGEIYVGGGGVMRAYHNRPRLTAERLIPDLFGGDGARMYRSGDLARRDRAGEIVYEGRIDHQVKIRGFRIELGEIENALRSHDGVGDAVVLARADTPTGDKRLLAWTTPAGDGEAPDETALRAFLADRLPIHMLPARIVSIAALPMTANGKLNRDALHVLNMPCAVQATPTKATDNRVRILSQVWSDVLGMQISDPGANFFSSGGDSILALRILSRVKDQGYVLNLADIYRHPKLSDCAAAMRPDLGRGAARRSEADRNDAGPETIPMSAMQGGMIYHSQLDPGSLVFHDVFVFDIALRFDEAKWRATLKAAAAWSPALRSSFDWLSERGPVQTIASTAAIPLTIDDLRDQDGTDYEAALSHALEREREQPFAVDEAPLIRTRVQITADNGFRLLISFHHAVMDGWSFATLVAAMLADYQGLDPIASRPSHGTAQRQAGEAERHAMSDPDEQAFWKDYVAQLDGPTHPVQTRADPVVEVRDIPHDLTDALTDLGKALGISLKTLTLGVHLQAQMFLHGRASATTGYVLNCRPETVEGSTAIGMFLNTLPLAARDDGTATIGDWIDGLARAEAQIIEHRRMPLVEILKAAGRPQLFDCAFNFVHFHVYNDLLRDRISAVAGHQVHERTDLPLLVQFGLMPDTGVLRLTLVSNAIDLDAAHLSEMADLYLHALGEVARNRRPLSVTADTSLGTSIRDAYRARQTSNAEASPAPRLIHFDRDGETDVMSADQRAVANVWCEVLQRDVDALDRHFFEMGGDSISAVRVVALINNKTGVRVSIRDFLSNGTIRGIAATVAKLRDTKATTAGPKRVSRAFRDAPPSRAPRELVSKDAELP